MGEAGRRWVDEPIDDDDDGDDLVQHAVDPWDREIDVGVGSSSANTMNVTVRYTTAPPRSRSIAIRP